MSDADVKLEEVMRALGDRLDPATPYAKLQELARAAIAAADRRSGTEALVRALREIKKRANGSTYSMGYDIDQIARAALKEQEAQP